MSTKYIDMTPTWEQAAAILVRCVMDGENYTARRNAADELIKMGRQLDSLNDTAEQMHSMLMEKGEKAYSKLKGKQS